MKKITQGTFHQNNKTKYPSSAGKQCTCNSLIGLINLPQVENYTPDELDNIMDEGDELYRVQDVLHPKRKTPHLSFDELPMENITSRNTNYTIKRHDKYHCVKGSLYRLDSDEGLTYSLDTALNNSLQHSHTLLILIGEFSICMFYAHGNWCIFDSHCNNMRGQYDKSGRGKAILMQFPDLQNARNYIEYYIQERATKKYPMIEFQPITLTSVGKAHAQKRNWFENYLNFEEAKRMESESKRQCLNSDALIRPNSYADALRKTQKPFGGLYAATSTQQPKSVPKSSQCRSSQASKVMYKFLV